MAKNKSTGAASAQAALEEFDKVQPRTAPVMDDAVVAQVSDIPVISANRGSLMRKALEHLNEGSGQASRHRKSVFGTLGAQRKNHIPLPHLGYQYLFGQYGVVYPGVVELIGDADTGKSTMSIELLGSAMLQLKAEGLLISCEAKPVSRDRALRALHPNPLVAAKLIDRISVVEAFSLPQFEDVLRDWVLTMREVQKLPLSIPLFVIVDPWSGLMTKGEAVGEFQYLNRKEEGEKMKPTGEGSNLGHSKWAHIKRRKLPAFITLNNVFILLINHQTVNIDMSGGASYAPQWVKDSNNSNAIGGKAWKQLAVATVVLALKGATLDENKKPIGRRVIAKMHKNSYGPGYRSIMFDHIVVHDDRDKLNYQDPPLHFEQGLCQLLAEKKIAGIRVRDDLYAIDFEDLQYSALTAFDLNRFVHEHIGLRSHVTRLLKISGYDDVVKQIERTEAAIADIDNRAFPAAEPATKPVRKKSTKAKRKKK